MVTTVVLLAVGLTVGLLSSRALHLRASATTRQAELRHLIAFAEATASPHTRDELTAIACEHISALLDLRGCSWQPGGPIETVPETPLLLPTGALVGYTADLSPDRAMLPDRLELPAIAQDHRLGAFLLTPRQGRYSSFEERRTAAVIATLYAAASPVNGERSCS